ncbi:hypothetical protein [Nocardioides nanhaiensis]|uniref:Uncharacterized protein n=1 Tax=Nocardioides nanhaiensis TaxID=1476871 RepID=A0ABP8VZ66_9ACTN
MKLRRRDPVAPEHGLEPPTPAPVAPRGAPRATYAGVLDGRHLWLAVALAPGQLAVQDRAEDATEPLPLPTDLLDDQPEHRSVRTDLETLALTSAAGYDLVLVAPGGRARRIWSPPLPQRRTPARDGLCWEVHRDDDGLLSLHRTAVPEHVELAAVEVLAEGLRLAVHPPAGLVLRAAEGDHVLAALTDGLLTVDAVDGVPAQVARVTTTDGRPVLRRDDDLLNPGRGAPLPDLYLPGSSVREPVGVERLRLRWTDRGLTAQVLDPAAAGGGA